ncbi:regulator of telomere elongation helicase 1 homolog [Elysia marginata]|uniref:Regulator of telomere elongation helicase 1 homolog n=1 Tax=Elysia marginata TaxID=1093978 RepID=A0AAV4EEH8_9GAST|nr:regulator of telomere elongation helicase 1 homolog [Elysia marginata]
MSHQEYKISGVSVLFPCKPYPSQFSMMDKILKGIERRQNCLLESPTGSGKSLALLCSALAWQAAEKAKKDLEDAQDFEKAQSTCDCNVEKGKSDLLSTTETPKASAENKETDPAEAENRSKFGWPTFGIVV